MNVIFNLTCVETPVSQVRWCYWQLSSTDGPDISLVLLVRTFRGSDPGGGREFLHLSRPALRPTQPPVQYNGYRVFPGGKERQGRDADPSPPSSAEVKNRVELYLYLP